MKHSLKTFALAAAIAASAYSQADWSAYSLTSTGAEMVPKAMTEDDSGNVYVIGTTPGGNGNICVQKFSSTGTLTTSAEFGNGTDSEEGFDIAYGADGNLYLLGRSGSALWTQCITTGLSSVWQDTITTTTPGGSTSPNVPYRIAMGGNAGSPIFYATAQVRETLGGTINLNQASAAKAVFVAKKVSGGTASTATWNLSGTPDNLYGAYAISNGLALVTDSKYAYSSSFGSSSVSRVQYTKFDSSLSFSWTTPSGTVDPNSNNHQDSLSQSWMKDDVVYTSFTQGTIDPVTTDYQLDSTIGMDCSGGSAGSWIPSPTSYHRPGYVTANPNRWSVGLGVRYWNDHWVAAGNGAYVSLTSDGDTFPTYYGSWIRDVASGDSGGLEFGILNTSGSSLDVYKPEQNQRSFDAVNGKGICLSRFIDQTHFYSWGYKSSVNTATNTITSGYSIDFNRQTMASHVSDRFYVLLDVYNGSSVHRTALYMFSI